MSQPKITFDIPEDLAEMFVSGVFGGVSPLGANLILFVEDPVLESSGFQGNMIVREIKRKATTRLRMTPTTFKIITAWMNGQLQKYEEKYGKINLPGNQDTERPTTGMDFQ